MCLNLPRQHSAHSAADEYVRGAPVLRRWVHCSGLTYGHTVMVHERDRGFLRTLARLVVALTLTGIVMVAVVTWLPEWAQGCPWP